MGKSSTYCRDSVDDGRVFMLTIQYLVCLLSDDFWLRMIDEDLEWIKSKLIYYFPPRLLDVPTVPTCFEVLLRCEAGWRRATSFSLGVG